MQSIDFFFKVCFTYTSTLPEVFISCFHSIAIPFIVIKSWSGSGWNGLLRSYSSNPLPWARLPSTSSGSPGPLQLGYEHLQRWVIHSFYGQLCQHFSAHTLKNFLLASHLNHHFCLKICIYIYNGKESPVTSANPQVFWRTSAFQGQEQAQR